MERDGSVNRICTKMLVQGWTLEVQWLPGAQQEAGVAAAEDAVDSGICRGHGLQGCLCAVPGQGACSVLAKFSVSSLPRPEGLE